MSEHLDVQLDRTSGSAPLSVSFDGSFFYDHFVPATGRLVIDYGDTDGPTPYSYLIGFLPTHDDADYPVEITLAALLSMAIGHPEAGDFQQHVYSQKGTFSASLLYQRSASEPIFTYEAVVSVGGGVEAPSLYAINFQGSGGTGDKEPRLVIFKRGELNSQSWL